MFIRLLQSGKINVKQGLLILTGLLLLAASISFGSYAWPEKELTARRSALAFIPRQYRLNFIGNRLRWGVISAGGAALLASGWLGAELLSRAWQKGRNQELAANAVLLRLAPRVDEQSKWEAAADLWRAVQASLARPATQVWLGGGLHLSFELVQPAGERISFYLWIPRPSAETVVRQLKATYAGLEVELMVKGSEAGPTDEMDDYLARIGAATPWTWADLGLRGEPWRPLRTEFAGDPLASLLAALEGLAAGNDLAALHFLLRPAAPAWQQGGPDFIKKLRGDNLKTKPGRPRPRPGGQERLLIKQIEQKANSLGYDLCLRLLVAGRGDLMGNLARLIQVFDQFSADNALAVRKQGDGSQFYRLEQRFFPAGWGRSVVGEQELAALAHLPNRDLTGSAISRARARSERPSPASFVQPGEKRVVLGRFADVPSFGTELTPAVTYPLQWLRQILVEDVPYHVSPLRGQARVTSGASTSSARPGWANRPCCCGWSGNIWSTFPKPRSGCRNRTRT